MHIRKILSVGMTALMICCISPATVFAQETSEIKETQVEDTVESTQDSESVNADLDETEISSEPSQSEESETVKEPEKEVDIPVIEEDKKEQPVSQPNNSIPSTEKEAKPFPYQSSTWYHPVNTADLGYVGETKDAIKLDNFITHNYDRFIVKNNPFQAGQCTWFAWSRFYQVYGFDSGARGNGKTNAAEIVKVHPDKFQLSSTPAAGATFSMEKNTVMPEYGHVGFVEAFDGEYLWISEGNVSFSDTDTGNIWIHKVKWSEFQKQYPDVVFAVPEKELWDESDVIYQKIMDVSNHTIQSWMKVLEGTK